MRDGPALLESASQLALVGLNKKGGLEICNRLCLPLSYLRLVAVVSVAQVSIHLVALAHKH